MNRIIQLIKENNWLVNTIVAVLMVIVGIQQFRISVLESEKAPKLVYDFSQQLDLIQNTDLEVARTKLEGQLFKAVQSYVDANPNASYSEALSQVLPINVDVSLPPSVLLVIVQNEGNETDTQIRINVSLSNIIRDIQITTSEVYSIIRGGLGGKSVTIQIDRLTPQKSVQLAIFMKNIDHNYVTTLVAERGTAGYDQLYGVSPEFWNYLPAFELSRAWNLPTPTSTKINYDNRNSIILSPPITFIMKQSQSISPNIEVTSNEVSGSSE